MHGGTLTKKAKFICNKIQKFHNKVEDIETEVARNGILMEIEINPELIISDSLNDL